MDTPIFYEGEYSRIGVESTPYQEGCIYMTTDKGGLYIDLDGRRYEINPESKPLTATLTHDGWEGNTQSLTFEGLRSDSNGVMGVASGVTKEQYQAALTALLVITEQTGNVITITAMGEVPSEDIPVMLIIFGR